MFYGANSLRSCVVLKNKIVRIPSSCDLRQVTDGDELMAFRHFSHHTSQLKCDLARNPAVDLIKHKRWHFCFLSHHIFNTKHQPREFATRCHLCKRSW